MCDDLVGWWGEIISNCWTSQQIFQHIVIIFDLQLSADADNYLPMYTKQEIDQWLKTLNKDRKWLAEQCGVSYGQVNNWMSKNREIPKKALIIIDNLMNQPQPADDSQISIADLDINLKVSHDKFLEFNNYAKACGMNIVDWIIYVLEYAGDNKELLMKRLQEEKNKGE